MELSGEVLEGLQLVGNSAHVSDKCFNPLISRVLKDCRDTDGPSEIALTGKPVPGLNAAVFKQAYAALYTLVLEAAKHDADRSNVSAVLEDCKFAPDRIEAFSKAFESAKPELRALLSNIGTQFRHVVDVDWRLDYFLKNNHLDKMNEPVYMITLKTEAGDQQGVKNIQFSCSIEQLQDMVGKLKDATKSMEKLAQST
ncbi:COMM domain-containing protein 3-like [Apostichopus japonicus]|uniref:COMM domain-containing protein 3-like n=1 Tax=Stichopus japonicus TaxID=307972 RepID=UPI003AB21BA1